MQALARLNLIAVTPGSVTWGRDIWAATSLPGSVQRETRVQIKSSIKTTTDWRQVSTAPALTSFTWNFTEAIFFRFTYFSVCERDVRHQALVWRVDCIVSPWTNYLNTHWRSKAGNHSTAGTLSFWQKQSRDTSMINSKLFLHSQSLLLQSY